MKISGVVCTLNEEKNIEDCLKSLSFCDEIVLVDSESTDNTLKIAKKYTKKIYKAPNHGYVEPVRNFAISKASNEFVFVLDADERVPQLLAKKLTQIATEESVNTAFWIPRKNLVFGEWNKALWPDYQLRFFRKGSVKWSDKIHQNPQVDGGEQRLEASEDIAILHYNYSSISQFVRKLNNYTDAEAKNLIDENVRFNFVDMITRPTDDFIVWYFKREGYKNGIHGFAFSALMAFYQFITILKIWEANGFEKIEEERFAESFEDKIKDSFKQINYWILQT